MSDSLAVQRGNAPESSTSRDVRSSVRAGDAGDVQTENISLSILCVFRENADTHCAHSETRAACIVERKRESENILGKCRESRGGVFVGAGKVYC